MATSIGRHMEVLVGAFQIVSVVIVASGVAKIVSPDGFASLLRSLGLPQRRSFAVLAGVAEVVLGTAALLLGGVVIAALVAAAYVTFAAVVLLARRSGAEDCGCFGVTSAPPSVLHAVVNLASGLVAAAIALTGDVPWIGEVLADQPAFGVPYLLALATGAWLVVALDTAAAEVLDGMGAVAELGPTFRESAAQPTHRHGRRRTRTGVAR